MFAVSPKSGLMPEWPGEVGENPTLTRNRDHACVVWESECQERRGGRGSVADYGVNTDAKNASAVWESPRDVSVEGQDGKSSNNET